MTNQHGKMILFVGLSLVLSACLSVTTLARESSATIADRVLSKAESILDNATDVHYEHLHCTAKKQIQDSGSIAHNDCSGFVSYLLAKYAPLQYKAISQEQPRAKYPQAKIYAQFFTNLSPSEKHSGWLKIESFRDLKRGDFIAWAKQTQPGQKAGNTGHVAIIAAPVSDVSEEKIDDKTVRFVSVKVVDSSSVDHFPPDLLPPHAGQQHRDGIGEGFVRIVLDAENNPVGYWEGTYWNEGKKPIQRPSYTPIIGYARIISLRD